MSRSIDEKVVELRFDNQQFESGVKESLGTLNNLKSAINKSASGKALDDLTKSANKIDLSGISKGIESLQDRFSTLGIIGMRVIENITDGLMNGLGKAIHSVTDSIVSGGVKRAMNIENAHFQLQGLIDDETEVQAIMQDAMDSVDGTAYAYDEAAKAASMFAASGLKSGEQMQKALMGIAGTAATTNAEYERVADIFTKVAGKGRIQAMELNQFAAMGMNAAAAITKYFNQVTQEGLEASDSVTESIQDLTGGLEVTEEAIRDFVSDGAISFEIFSEAMATSFGEHAKDANKTFTGSMANIRAALARTGAMFISPLIKQDGPFVQFFNAVRVKVNEFNKALGAANGLAGRFTTWVNNIVTKMTAVVESFQIANTYVRKFKDGSEKTFESSTKAIQKWGDGTQQIIDKQIYTPFHALVDIVDTVIYTFKFLGQVIAPIGKAFKDTFAFDSSGIYKAIESMRQMASTFKVSESAASNIYDLFKGLFDVISFGAEIIARLVSELFGLSTGFDGVGSSILDVLGSFGRYLSYLVQLARESELLNYIFDKFQSTLMLVKSKIEYVVAYITQAISDMGFGSSVESEYLTPLELLQAALNNLKAGILSIFAPVNNILNTLKNAISNIVGKVMPVVQDLGRAILDMISNIDPLTAFIALLDGTLLLNLIKRMNTIKVLAFGFKGKFALFGNLEETLYRTAAAFKSFVSQLGAFTKQMGKMIDAEALKRLASAILILAVAMLILSSIDFAGLAKGILAVSIMLGELLGAMMVLNKFMTSVTSIKGGIFGIMDAAKTAALAQSLIAVASAVAVLALAVTMIGQLNFKDIVKGLGAVTILLGEMLGTLIILDKVGIDNVKSIGFGMIEIAVAIGLLGKAVKKIGSLDLSTIVKGLGSIFVLLLGLAKFSDMTKYAEDLIKTSTAMILLSLAISKMAKPIKEIGGMPFGDIVVGLGSVLGLMYAMSKFIQTTGSNYGNDVLKSSLSMIVLAKGVQMLASAVRSLGTMNFEQWILGLTGMASVMFVLMRVVEGLSNTTGGIQNAIGSVVIIGSVCASINKLLVPALVGLSKVSWSGMLIALGGMAGAMIILTTSIASITGIVDQFGKWKMAKAVAVFGSFAAILYQPVSETLKKIASVGWDGLAISLMGMFVAIGIITSLIEHLGNMDISKSIPGAIMFAAICTTLKPIAKTIKEIASVSWEGLSRSLLGLLGVVGILLGAMYLAGAAWQTGIPIAGTVLMMLMTTTLKPITKSLVELSSASWSSIADGLKAMGIAMLILIAAMYVAGLVAPFAITGALSIRVVAKAMVPIAESLVALSQTNWEHGVKDSLLALAGVLAILIAALHFMKKVKFEDVKQGVMSLIMVAAILGPIESITSVLWDKEKENIVSLCKTLAAILVASMIMGVIATVGLPAAASLRIFTELVSGSIKSLASSISGMVDVIHDVKDIKPEEFKGTLLALAEALAAFGLSLKAFGLLSNVGASAVEKIANALATLAPALKDFEKADPDKTRIMLENIGEGLKVFGSTMKEYGLIVSLYAPNAMLKIAEAVAKLAPAIQTLSTINQNQLVSILESLGDAFKAFGEALDATPFWGSTMRANGIGALIDNISKLTEVLPAFISIPASQARESLTILGNAFKGFGEALTATPFWDAGGRAQGIGSLINTIPKLTEVIPPFSDVVVSNGDNIKNALDLLKSAFVDFGTALSTAPMFNADERGAGISILINSIESLKNGIESFKDVDGATFGTTLGKISAGFKIFGESIEAAPLFNSNERATAISMLVDSISTLADGISKFVAISAECDEMGLILGKVSGAFKSFGTAISNAPLFNAEERSTAIVAIVDSLGTLADGIETLANVESKGDSVNSILDTIGNAMLNFGDAIKKTPFWGTEARSSGLIGVVESISTLTESVMTLNQLDAGQLDSILGSLSTGLGNLGNAMKSFDEYSQSHADTIKAVMESVKDSADIDSNNLMLIARNLKTLMATINETDSGAVSAFAQGLAEAAKVGLTQFIAAFQNTDEAVAAITEFMKLVTQSIKSSTLFKDAGSESVVNYRKGIEAKYSEAATAGRNLATRVINALKAMVAQFHSVGTTSAQGYAAGILAGGATAAANARTIATTAANNMNPTDDSGVSVFYKQGMNAGQGYAQGIASQLKAVQEAAAKLAKAAEAALAKAQEAKSPAKKFIRQGEYAGEGYVIGITSWMQDAYNAGKGLANAVDNSLEDAGSLTPVITPIVDLTNVIDAAGTINSLFSSAIMSTGIRTNSVAGSFATATNNSNTEFQNEAVGSNGNTYNFIQNNNSPKSLSRVEIYRDSKNLFKQYREAVEGV